MPADEKNDPLKSVAPPEAGLSLPKNDIPSVDTERDEALAQDFASAHARAAEVVARLSGTRHERTKFALLKFASDCIEPMEAAGFDGKAGLYDTAKFVKAVYAEALATGTTPVCVLHFRPVPAVEGKRPSHDAKRSHSKNLSADEACSGLRYLAKSIDAAQADNGCQIVLDAEPWLLRTLEVSPDRGVSAEGRVGWWTILQLYVDAERLFEFVRVRDADLLVILTTLPRGWERREVRKSSDQSTIQAAAKLLLDSAEKVDLASPTLDPQAGLMRLQAVWEAARSEVKVRLETVIKQLSRQTYSTYEEKFALASQLVQVMDRWGFQAKSPMTGNASVLRVRRSSPESNGKFQFDEKPRPEEDLPVSRRSPKGGRAQLPEFTLVDRPPDLRRKAPN